MSERPKEHDWKSCNVKAFAGSNPVPCANNLIGINNMIYKIGMLCKHFKGRTLAEKNIYEIKALEVNGHDIDSTTITYTGDGELASAQNLVIYANIFQDNKLFAREYEDISGELSADKQELFSQTIKVQPLTSEEIAEVQSPQFISFKKIQTMEKYK